MIPKFDIYSDAYYETLNGTFHDRSQHIHNYGSPNTFLRGFLALLLRAGFVLVQLGSVPIENVYIILLQNVVDIALSIASFGLVGYILAFGLDSMHGAIGHGIWLISDKADFDNAVLGFSACMIATAIITTLLSGRLHFVGYLLNTLLFSMLFQPAIMHWVWHESGWLRRRYFMEHLVSLKDHAGGLVVHVSGGVVGFIGALFLGRRLMRLTDIDESSIGVDSPGSTITGYIFIALGLIGFSLPVPSYELRHMPDNYIGIILVNNIMAMAGGIIVVVILQFLLYREPFNYWIILRCIQGAIAGIVAISCGIDVYTPILAFAIGSGAAVLFYFVTICVHNSSVEDYCNVVPIHLICGCLGLILPPLLGSNENLGVSTSFHVRLIHLGWQIVGGTAVCLLLTVIFMLYFAILLLTGFLRNKSEAINHKRGVAVSIRGPDRCCLQRLFTLHPNTPYIEPGSFGKSPKQINTYPKTTDFVPNSSPKQETKKLRKAATVNDGVIQVATAEIVYDSTAFHTLKPKSIFTINNENKIVEGVETSIGSFGGSGDSGRNSKEGSFHNSVEKKLDELSMEKQHSHQELRKTKKDTNLLRNRYSLKRKMLQTIRKINFSQGTQHVSHDTKFTDGFVAIKMPGLGENTNLSDSSD